VIIAIADQLCVHGKRIAVHLAALRAGGGHSVLTMDAGRAPGLGDEIARQRPRYHDIVIDTDGADSADSRAALAAARLAIVPVEVGQADLVANYKLIAHLNAARMFNPGLHVLFVAIGGAADPTPAQHSALRRFVGHVMSATLSRTVVHDSGALPAALDIEMHALYREVFAT
jgi:chromosome partitioning protein